MTPLKKKDTFEEYLGATDFIGSSTLKKAKRSGYHYKYQQIKDSPDFKLGRAIHCAVLEPDDFDSRYTYFSRNDLPYPERRLNLKENDAKKTEILEKAKEAGMELLEEVEYHVCNGINKQFKEKYNEIYELVLNSEIETSFYAQDPETGLYLKARPDSVYQSRGIMFDLKSTSNAHPPIWTGDCKRYDYPLQAAFHAKVFELVTGQPIQDYFYIVAEKSSPYAVSIFRLDDENMQQAKDKVNDLLKWVKWWEDNQYFPSYESYADPEDFGVIDLKIDTYYFQE